MRRPSSIALGRARGSGFGVLLLALAHCGFEPRPRPTHVLLITLDTLRADRLGCYGGNVATPHLDALAARGVLFEQASTPVPLTAPAHASLFSGRYPWRHGLSLNGVRALDSRVPLLSEELAAQGMQTAAFVGAFPLKRQFGLDRGFAVYDDGLGSAAAVERPGDEVTAAAIAWLDAHHREPFFLWVHYFDCHTPYAAPEPYAAAHPADPYAGEVAFVDAQVGRMTEALERLGLRGQTLVVVAADHGEGLFEHGEPEHGLLLYETTLRVPLILAGPGLPAGARIAPPVSLVDVRPTVLAALGIPASAAGDGIDLESLVRGRPAPDRVLLAESRYPELELGWSRLRAVRRGSHKAIIAPRPELFDLAADPRERRDLVAVRPADLTDLLGRAVFPPDGPAESPVADEETTAALASLGYLGGAPVAAAEQPGPDPKDRMEDFVAVWRAVRLGADGRHAEALTTLRNLAACDPDNPQFQLQLGEALARAGHALEAEAVFQSLLAKHPGWSLIARRIASLLVASGRPREAVGLLASYRAEHPEVVGLEEPLALALEAAGDPEAALAVVGELLAARPHDTSARSFAGQVLARLGRLTDARALLEQVLAQDPGNIEATVALARVLAGAGDAAGALRRVERALAAHPGEVALAAQGCRIASDALQLAAADRLCGRERELTATGAAAGPPPAR